MNQRIANGAKVRDLTLIVRGSYETADERQMFYNLIYSILNN
jgi:hypothetical protein